MKKIFSFALLFVGLFLLSACSGNDIGEYPEIKENQKIDMTAQEVTTLLSDVDMQTQMEEAMMLSVDVDMTMVEEDYDYRNSSLHTVTSTIELVLSSKTYLFLSEQISEAGLVSNNEVDVKISEDYENPDIEDTVESLKGDLDVYFTNQYLYYNADLTSTADEDEMIENGKFKLNVGITQEMWSQIFTNPEDLIDGIYNSGINPEELIADAEVLEMMINSGMMSTYKDGSTYTFVMTVTKQKIVENINNVIDLVMDTTGWTSSDYSEYSIEMTETLEMFDKLDMSVAYVIEGDQLQKIGIEMDVKMDVEGTSLDLVGTIIMDMSVEMPKFPKDLDEYELSDMSLY